ncbi:DUF5462 family protein [Photobacterium leiognathi]|uniref:DUF5462 family protein n=1 Tax=Photobacterium leiognathi TaxID=553611 RepID=UPI00298289CF|nr:DUF5462 family protein [Photobacterium leiognathi]
MYKIIIRTVCLLFLFNLPLSCLATVLLPNNDISLGAVNGKVIDANTVKIEKTLDKDLFYIDLKKFKKHINTIVIDNAYLKKTNVENNLFTLSFNPSLKLKSTKAEGTFLIEARDEKNKVISKIIPVQEGDDINIPLPINTKIIVMKARSPLEIILPKNFRGDLGVQLKVIGVKI